MVNRESFSPIHHLLFTIYLSSRYKHTQCAWPNAIVQRRVHGCDFAIHGYTQAAASCLNPNLFRAERVEILFVTQTAKERAHCKSKQPQSSRSVRNVQTQLSFIKAGARAKA